MRRLPIGPLLILLAGGLVAGALGASPATVTLENEAIRLTLNNTDDGRGRFAVDITGGDRTRATDDGQPLIYGRPVPWTSFTTIRLDGHDYSFGGATARRSGKGLAVGKEVIPPLGREGALVTTWRYGDLEVTQHLSIAEGPTTGRPDTARIAYTMVNRGPVRHRVGLRVCLDTMLGGNDGAPFRLGQRQILSDETLRGSTAEPYWQAFDSLGEPRVIAQGTLAGGELTPPDRIYFTNWGTLADDGWEPALVAGRDFTRLGEFEPDSAVALLWEEADLPPGGVLNRVTYYGLGGVTIAQGRLSLGLTAPAGVPSGQGNTFMILGYLENRGEGVAQEAALTLELPRSLRPLSPLRVELGRIRSGESRQVAWMVEAVGTGTARIKVTANAFRLPAIAVERDIRLVAPARLEVTTLKPPVIQASSGRYLPYPVPLTAVVANRGGDIAPGGLGPACAHARIGTGARRGKLSLVGLARPRAGNARYLGGGLRRTGGSGRLYGNRRRGRLPVGQGGGIRQLARAAPASAGLGGPGRRSPRLAAGRPVSGQPARGRLDRLADHSGGRATIGGRATRGFPGPRRCRPPLGQSAESAQRHTGPGSRPPGRVEPGGGEPGHALAGRRAA